MVTGDIYKDGTYLKHNPNWHLEESEWKAAQVEKVIKRNNLCPSSICEVGCGAGEVIKILSQHFGENVLCAGYDISPQAYEICSKKRGGNLTFHLKDFTEEEGIVFDIVLALDVVEHVEDYYKFLRKVKSRGRYKIFHIPLQFCAKNAVFMSHIIDDMKSVGHIHYFSKEIILSVLEKLGYRIIDHSYINKHSTRRNLKWKSKVLRMCRNLLYPLHKDKAVGLLGGYSISILAE